MRYVEKKEEVFTFTRSGLSNLHAATTKAIYTSALLPLNPNCDVLPCGLDSLFSCVVSVLCFGIDFLSNKYYKICLKTEQCF